MKDRYSKTFLFMGASAAMAIFFIRNDKYTLATASIVASILPLIYLINTPARLHLTKDQAKQLNAEYKGEEDCHFTHHYKQEVDGIRLNGQRYKFINGTDICLNSKKQLAPCGLGSYIMQHLGGGGVEPASIQDKECWK